MKVKDILEMKKIADAAMDEFKKSSTPSEFICRCPDCKYSDDPCSSSRPCCDRVRDTAEYCLGCKEVLEEIADMMFDQDEAQGRN